MLGMMAWVFPDFAAVDATDADASSALGKRMILTPLNRDVAVLNNMAIDLFPGDMREYLSMDTVVDEGSCRMNDVG